MFSNKKENVDKIQMQVLTEYFKKLNVDDNTYDEHDWSFNNVNAEDATINSFINEDFDECEIRKVVKGLKNNKAYGVDMILNEFIKNTIDIMCPIYVKLFNNNFEDWLPTGKMDCWNYCANIQE